MAKYLCFLYFQIMDVSVRVLPAEKNYYSPVTDPAFQWYGATLQQLLWNTDNKQT